MISWIGGGEPKCEAEGESRAAMEEQEAKLQETLLTIKDVHDTAAKSRRLLDTDLLAIAIERSMRRA